MIHLWEVSHPYYCSDHEDGRSPARRFGSWQEFVDSWPSDVDLNLLVRWDWVVDEDDGPGDVLWLYFVQQRVGRFDPVSVSVRVEDEAAIRAWLQQRWDHMIRLWDGVADVSPNPGGLF